MVPRETGIISIKSVLCQFGPYRPTIVDWIARLKRRATSCSGSFKGSVIPGVSHAKHPSLTLVPMLPLLPLRDSEEYKSGQDMEDCFNNQNEAG